MLSINRALAALVAGLGGVASTGPAAQAETAAPTAYACSFDKGTSWSVDAGAMKPAQPSPLNFEISAIDVDKQTAELTIEQKPAGKLRVVRALNANSFLEVANEGFLNLTTIYDLDSALGAYPAVHSRHFGILGQPVFAQYAGTCKAR